MKRGVSLASAQVSQGDCAFQAYPYRHGFQHGCSQVVSPVVGLCQYGAPEASSTCSSHPGGSDGALMARGGGSAGGLAAAHVTRESRPPSAPPPASAAGCSQVVSPVLSLYQYFCGARGDGDGRAAGPGDWDLERGVRGCGSRWVGALERHVKNAAIS